MIQISEASRRYLFKMFGLPEPTRPHFVLDASFFKVDTWREDTFWKDSQSRVSFFRPSFLSPSTLALFREEPSRRRSSHPLGMILGMAVMAVAFFTSSSGRRVIVPPYAYFFRSGDDRRSQDKALLTLVNRRLIMNPQNFALFVNEWLAEQPADFTERARHLRILVQYYRSLMEGDPIRPRLLAGMREVRLPDNFIDGLYGEQMAEGYNRDRAFRLAVALDLAVLENRFAQRSVEDYDFDGFAEGMVDDPQGLAMATLVYASAEIGSPSALAVMRNLDIQTLRYDPSDMTTYSERGRRRRSEEPDREELDRNAETILRTMLALHQVENGGSQREEALRFIQDLRLNEVGFNMNQWSLDVIEILAGDRVQNQSAQTVLRARRDAAFRERIVIDSMRTAQHLLVARPHAFGPRQFDRIVQDMERRGVRHYFTHAEVAQMVVEGLERLSEGGETQGLVAFSPEAYEPVQTAMPRIHQRAGAIGARSPVGASAQDHVGNRAEDASNPRGQGHHDPRGSRIRIASEREVDGFSFPLEPFEDFMNGSAGRSIR